MMYKKLEVKPRRVEMLNGETHKVIREFESVKEAAKFNVMSANAVYASIKRCSKDKQGHRWRYAE